MHDGFGRVIGEDSVIAYRCLYALEPCVVPPADRQNPGRVSHGFHRSPTSEKFSI